MGDDADIVGQDENVRRNFWGARIQWARSATKHRISRERSRFVIEHWDVCARQGAPANQGRSQRLLFLGDDASGVGLEVAAAALEDGSLLMIHAMPVRERYQTLYEEGVKWRR